MFVNFNILNQLGSPAINSNTFANRPAAGQTGRLFVSTDTYEIYRDNGTTWDLIGGPGSSTITGTGTATQVAYFTSSQAIGSSANLFWDNTNTRLGVGTAVPGYTIEANGSIKVNSVFLSGATGGSGALYWTSDRVTVANYNVGGIVVIETNGGPSAATFGADYTATFVSGIGTRGYTGSTSYGALFNGSVGINTATPGAALDVHSTGTIAQFNTTSATGNTYIAFQRTGTGLWRVGDTYNGGPNQFEIHNTVLGIDAVNIKAATNKTSWQATENYTSGVARGNYFDYNLTLNPANPLASPNAISAVGASLDLTLQGSITIPSGARSGLDAYNSISFTTTGTLTHNQGTQIRAYSNLTAGWAFNGSATGTITHLAGLHALFPDNSGSAVNVTNNYALLLNDQTANTGTVTYTNRWGVYQEGASDLNYMAANLLLGSTTNSGEKLQVTGNIKATGGINVTTETIQSGGILYLNNNDNSQAAYLVSTGTGGNAPLIFATNSAEKMRLNSAGNLGLGVTPSAWASGYKAFEFGNNSAAVSALFSNGVNDFWAVSNVYFDGSNFRYINTGTATGHEQVNGTFIWNSAPSGSAGSIASFKQYMKLDDSGRLGIGTSTPAYSLDIYNATNSQYINVTAGICSMLFGSSVANLGILGTISNHNLDIRTNNTSAIRVITNGNVLIGTTTDAGYKLDVNGTGAFADSVIAQKGQNTTTKFEVKNTTVGTNSDAAFIVTSDASTGQTVFGKKSSGVTTYKILTPSAAYWYNGTAGDIAILNDFSSGAIKMSAGGNSTAQFTLTTSGNVETTGSIKTAAPTTGTAANWKLGSRVAATVVVNTTEYIEVDIGGTLYKLATVT